MIPGDRLDQWQREALVLLSSFHGTADERAEAAARQLALIQEVRDMTQHLEGGDGQRAPFSR